MNEDKKLWEYLPEFVKEFEAQLRADDVRWGDTWLNRTKKGQEERLYGDVKDYFDRFYFGGEPMPYMKVIGNAFICWMREQHPELSDAFKD